MSVLRRNPRSFPGLFRPLALGILVALPTAVCTLTGAGDEPPAGTPTATAAGVAVVQQMLQLLAGIRGEYAEAFDDHGTVVRPIDIDEARLLVTELQDLSARQSDAASIGLPELMDGLTVLVAERVPPVVVETYAEVFRRSLIQSTGVREDTLPATRPSLARGRELFVENCAGCHGPGGQGDGPDAKRLGITPRSFTDVVLMRRETPQDAFNVIRLGRQKSGMPAWGEAFSPQQVWDLVSYIWSLARTPEAVRDGQRIYHERCARCHGESGDPARSQAANLDRPTKNLAAILDGSTRADADLFQEVSDGMPHTPMPAFAPQLTEGDRWAVVAFVRTLSLEGAPGALAVPFEVDRRAEMQDVSRLVDAAIAAH